MSPMCWLTKTSSAAGQRDGVLEMGAARAQDRRRRPPARRRRTGAGAQPRARRSSRASPARTQATLSSTWRAIGRSWTRKQSAMPPSRVDRLALVDADRLVAQVAAGRHDREAQLGQEQRVQRRVGQHDAQVGVAGRHLGGDPGCSGRRRSRTIGASARPAAAPPRRTARRARRRSRGPGPSAPAASRRGACARAAGRRRRASRASTTRWKPPSPLTATMPAGTHRVGGPAQRLVARRQDLAASVPQRQPRPADRAGVGLGVEAPVLAGPRTPAGSRRTSRSRPSSSPAGRRARRG